MAPHEAARSDSTSGKAHKEMTAAGVFAALREVRPDKAVLVEGSPSNLADLHTFWPVTKPASFFTFASGGLAWSLPASVGIALGERDTERN